MSQVATTCGHVRLDEPTPGERMQRVAPICGIIGVFVGAISAVTQIVGLGLAVIVTVVFFAASNCLKDSAMSTPLLGTLCCVIGAHLGWSFGFLWMVFTTSLDTQWPWHDDVASNLRFPCFVILVMIFHSAEYSFSVVHHAEEANFRSFLFTPVPACGYSIAIILAIAEFWAEMYFGRWRWIAGTPGLVMVAVGFLLSFLGWITRTLALFTAASNFTHLVAHDKEPEHRLVKHGVYKLCRHPGYLGWFVWCVSSQLVLGNPVCVLLYAFVAWKFFQGRIPGEERLLIDFFGQDYLEYAELVPCGVPFISDL